MPPPTYCPVCKDELEEQPIIDLTTPFWCHTCKCCYGHTVFADPKVLKRLDREPQHRGTFTNRYGFEFPTWLPGAPHREKKWYK